MATYQLGKIVGIALAGVVMTTTSYAGIFGAAVIAWTVMGGFAVAYYFMARRRI